MATIASIAVDFIARTGKFEKSVDRTEKKVKGFAKTTRSSLAMAAKHWKSFAGAIAGSVVINSLRQTALELDKIAKTASKLGIAVGELQSLQHAAQLTGVETNTLNMALQRMVRRIAEAAQGTGEAKNAIKELGLDAERLSALAPERQFAAIAGAMSKVSSQSDKVRLAFKLFDSEGVSLINTLDLGVDGLRKTRTEFQKLGGAIADADVKKVEQFNDAMTRLGVIFKGIKNDLVIYVAPLAENVVKKVEKSREKTRHPEFGASGIANTFIALGRFIGGFFTDNPNLREAQTLTPQQARRFGPGGGLEFESIANAERERIKRREANIKIERRLEREAEVNKRGFENRERSKQILERGLSQTSRIFNKLFLAQANLLEVGGERIGRGATAFTRGISERRDDEGPSPINRAVLADSREGFLALRRNLSPTLKENQKQTTELKRQTTLLQDIVNAVSPETLGLF